MTEEEKSRLNYLIQEFEEWSSAFRDLDFYSCSYYDIEFYIKNMRLSAKKIIDAVGDSNEPQIQIFLSCVSNDIQLIKKSINENK